MRIEFEGKVYSIRVHKREITRAMPNALSAITGQSVIRETVECATLPDGRRIALIDDNWTELE